MTGVERQEPFGASRWKRFIVTFRATNEPGVVGLLGEVVEVGEVMVRFLLCGATQPFGIPRGIESDGATYLIKRSMLLTEFDDPNVYDRILECEKVVRLKLDRLYQRRDLFQKRKKETKDVLKSIGQKHFSLMMKIREKWAEEEKKYFELLERRKSDLHIGKCLQGIVHISGKIEGTVFAHAHIMVGRRTRGGFSCYLHKINKAWQLTENGLEELAEDVAKKYLHISLVNPTIIETKTTSDGYLLLKNNLTVPHSWEKLGKKIPVLLSDIQHLQSMNRIRTKNIKRISVMIDQIKRNAVENIRTSLQ